MSNLKTDPYEGSKLCDHQIAESPHCKFGVIQCNITSQNGPAGLDMPMKKSPNLVNQLTKPKCLYQTITQMLDQSRCVYRCVICTCAAPMCCHGICVQGLHSTGHLQHPTQELAIRVATLTLTQSWLTSGNAKKNYKLRNI